MKNNFNNLEETLLWIMNILEIEDMNKNYTKEDVLNTLRTKKSFVLNTNQSQELVSFSLTQDQQITEQDEPTVTQSPDKDVLPPQLQDLNGMVDFDTSKDLSLSQTNQLQ